MSTTGTITGTIAQPDLDAPPAPATTESDDTPDAAHIVTQEDLMHSQLTGEAIEALCGKWWVPKRNPDAYPLCQACVDVLNGAPRP